MTTEISHSVPGTTRTLVASHRLGPPTSLFEDERLEPLSHFVIICHVIVQRPTLEKAGEVLTLRPSHEKSEGVISTTLIVQRLDALSVLCDVFEMTSQPRLQLGRRAVGGQVQGKAIKDLTRVALRPHAQPMLTRFSRGIRVDNVTARTVFVGSGGKTVRRKRAHKRSGQRGMVSRQLIQLTRREDHLFHHCDSTFFLSFFSDVRRRRCRARPCCCPPPTGSRILRTR